MRGTKLTIVMLTVALSGALACKGDEKNEQSEGSDPKAENQPADDKAQPAAAAATFDKETAKKPCEILTKDMVAEVGGIDASAIKTLSSGKMMCIYGWDDGRAMLGHMHVSKTAEQARAAFDRAYPDKTGAEVAADLKKVGESAGDEDSKKMATAVGGALSAGLTYEPVEGVGDHALLNVTRREQEAGGTKIVMYDNEMHVLVNNLRFTVQFDRENGQLHRDEITALANKVLAELKG